ncbi:DNA polymerase I [Rothia sp. P6271]|uniref:DNA polymerase I n=1 Tax=Rothia sp. P6271 TaxID=3402659 RepID=UPI003AD29FD4
MTTQESAKKTQKLLLIDGHSLAFRSFYGTPADVFVNAQGQHTNAVHGFLSTLLSLIKSEEPSHIVAAFDLSGGTFRTREYSEYKGGRSETPPEFFGQVELIQRLLDLLNIPWLTVPEYEADDIIATLTKTGRESGYQVSIVSGDRDSFQLISDNVTVLYPVTTGPQKGIRPMDAAAVQEKYLVPPHLYPDLAALTGEKADNLPGVPGVGPGFAAKWINEYGDLESIFAHADEIKGKKGQALREHIEDVRRNRRLNRLVDDLELPLELSDMSEYGPEDHQRLDEFFDELAFNSIRRRVGEVFPAVAEQGTTVSALSFDTTVETCSSDDGDKVLRQFLDTATDVITQVERSESVPERLSCAVTLYPVVSESAQQTGLAHERDLLGAVLVAGASSVWLDFTAMSPEVESAFARWLADESQPKILFDLKQHYKTLNARGFDLAGVVEDPMLSSYVCGYIPSARKRDFATMMDALCQEYLGVSLPQEPVSEEPQAELFVLEPSVPFEYCALVARHIQELAYRLHYRMVDDEQLTLYQDIELPMAEVLARMEQSGIAVDSAKISELKDYYDSFVRQATDEAYRLIGHEVNLSSPKQLQGVLFEELGLPKTRKLKSGYSTDAESIADLMTKVNPDTAGAQFLAALQTYRDFTKLKQTVEGLEKATAADGRIHTTFQQNVTATGRLSSTEPNLQNIPIRSEQGRKIRGVFIVDPHSVDGTSYETLLTADYSQIEMRIMVHLAKDEKLIEAYQSGEDLHRFVGSEVFDVAPEEVTSQMRAKVKAMSYGLAYGLSRFGLSKQLGIPVDEAGELTVNYFKRFGNVGRFLRSTVKQAHRDGYTETMFGRRRILPDLGSSNKQRREAAERAALNAPIQGTAADIVKIAMLNVYRRLNDEKLKSRMLLQVHDELILEVASGELEQARRILGEEMSTAVELLVPLDVQVGSGTSWQEAGH